MCVCACVRACVRACVCVCVTLTARVLHAEHTVHTVRVGARVLPGLKLPRVPKQPQDIWPEEFHAAVNHEFHGGRPAGQVDVVLVPEQGGRDAEREVVGRHLVAVRQTLDVVQHAQDTLEEGQVAGRHSGQQAETHRHHTRVSARGKTQPLLHFFWRRGKGSGFIVPPPLLLLRQNNSEQ